ncbi:PREDICTED: ABC transporter B family member 25-like isoform X2 [Amphimedon queenslandica]|uniref:Uncharacterized protein n=1 Tax=Amphimedon queenslandica TaxID=400682 RepID=A0AAN0JJS3_AMPQE|nr:PREDICTED: ABC transporter B family member 25-like isoform X2 [Amphimedon queenslandica]|eukprot:XP_019857036.1 PREDICTED: ABC transporter B family member 25-like isoform X2 [Amphimedon queenslandica]
MELPANIQEVPQGKRRPTKSISNLPFLRYTTLTSIIIAVDSLLSISLWIAGGDSSYMENNVEHFSIYDSTFDLACIAAVKGPLLIACVYYLEQYTLTAASTIIRSKVSSSQRLAKTCQVLFMLLSLMSLAYALTKGTLILLKDSETSLHITYKILCIVGVVSPTLEIILGLASFYFMRRLIHVSRLRLILDENENESGESKKKKADLKRLIKLAIPEYPLISLGLVMLLISNSIQGIIPYIFGYVIDLAVKNQTLCQEISSGVINVTGPVPHCSLWLMSREVLVLVGLFLVVSVASMFRAICFTLAGERFVARIRKNLFAAILRQEMGFFDTNRTGELTNRLASDTAVIQSAVTENVSILARYSLQLIISIGVMFWINARLTAVLLSVFPLISIAAVYYGRKLKDLRKKYQDKLALASSTAEESISNIRTVRAFTNEMKLMTSYNEDIERSYSLGKVISFLIGGFSGVVFILIYNALCLILWYGGYLVYHQKLSSGELTALMLYTLTLAMSFAFISNVYGEFMQAVGASIRIFELMDRIPLIQDGALVRPSFEGEILFKNVYFTYPSRPDEPVLKGVNFSVRPGEMVALVGPSGGGKSTIVNLIEHFYDLTDGNILISGLNVKDLDPSWYRRHIGIVNQEPVLFATTIKDNIAFGKENATQEEIEAAALQANAHDFIMSFEENYKTLVGERGVRLSGGQKQRVAIARALLLNPKILLLDEATSALDAESEFLVQEAIDRAMIGRTVLVIAHRLSTVRNASKVLVLNEGFIVEEGTHDELLSFDGIYKKLVLHQLTAGEGEGQRRNNNNI